MDLVAKLLEYTPESRLSAIEAMCHPFFDELRVEGQRMPNGKDFPPLFDFTREGMLFLPFAVHASDLVFCLAELSIRPDLMRQLVPPHCEPELESRGIRMESFVPIPLEQLRITLD